MCNQKTCYMCDGLATSREHVPPLCFFPEHKDIPEKDYRVNLITVPSCEEHNSRKSDDDSYIFFLISSSLSSRSVAQAQFSTKIIRALRRRPQMRSFISRNIPIKIQGEESIAYEVYRDRFDRVMVHIACGLYFHTYAENWQHEVIVHTSDLVNIGAADILDYHSGLVKLNDLAADSLVESPLFGENPDIFQYKIRRFQNNQSFLIGMLFYQGFGVFTYGSIESNVN